MANPFRQKKPSAPAIVAKGRFYLADETGRRISSYGQYLLLTSTYLWIDDTLSIPLESITELSTTKRGGRIQFWDAIAAVEMDFHFTLPGFFRPRMGVVSDFLREIAQQRERQSGPLAPNRHTSAASPLSQIDSCEECGSNGTDAYTFSTFRFIGIAPVAYSYRLTPQRFVLCREHARGRAHRVNMRNALFGYLGFPGFLAAPWYIVRNLRELRRHNLLTVDLILKSVLLTVILPLGCVAFLLFLFARWVAQI